MVSTVRFTHTLIDGQGWLLHTSSTPEQVDKSDDCFDVYGDGMLIDLDGAAPEVSGRAKTFTVVCGDLLARYHRAEFTVIGGYKKTLETGGITKHVVCGHEHDWVEIDAQRMIAERQLRENREVAA
jgi:hypothetical protein